MKKKYVLGILTVVVLMFGITACGKTTESTPEQNATQEEQKEDQDNDTSDQDVNQDGQNEQDQTQQEQTENTQDANNLGAGTITVYAQNKDVSGFDKKEVSLEAITPETVLSQLAAAGVLPSDTTVLSFTKKEKDGEQVIDLDLSEKFGTYIKEMGSSAEYLVKYLFFCKIGFGTDYKNGIKEGIHGLSKCRKVPFRMEHLGSYIRIEFALIRHTFGYAADWLKRKLLHK